MPDLKDNTTVRQRRKWCTKQFMVLVCVCILLAILCFVLIGIISNNKRRDGESPFTKDQKSQMEITSTLYGTTSNGDIVNKYTLTNKHGMKVEMISLGGCITSIMVPDKHGNMADVVLGFDSLKGYEENPTYFGSIVGRYANRIAQGRFMLDGEEYRLNLNDGENHLHGGLIGWNKKVWDVEIKDDHIILRYTSPDNDEKYPGEVKTEVIYKLTNENELIINYTAHAHGKATPINLTGHSYFNLGGEGSGTIYDHSIIVFADNYLPVTSSLIPTGEIAPVNGTSFDLREPTRLGDIMDPEGMELFDHNFCLQGSPGVKRVAKVIHPPSGRRMEVFSNQPAVQFYTGNFLDVTQGAKNGNTYPKHSAFCLETQNYPDAPNHANFPDSILRPGNVYFHHSIFKFSAV